MKYIFILFILFIKFPGPSGDGTQAKINIFDSIYYTYFFTGLCG